MGREAERRDLRAGSSVLRVGGWESTGYMDVVLWADGGGVGCEVMRGSRREVAASM